MNLDKLSARVRACVGLAGQARMALRCCRELDLILRQLATNDCDMPADAAHAVAGVEIMCAQLRHAIGHEQVDLEMAERLHDLQHWLLSLELPPSNEEHPV